MANGFEEEAKPIPSREYICIGAHKNDKEFCDVVAEWEKDPETEEIDVELLNTFYSRPVPVARPLPEGAPLVDFHWEALVTREQYDARVAEEKSVDDYTMWSNDMKKLVLGTIDEYMPIHTFGPRGKIRLPREKISEIQEEIAPRQLDKK